MLPARQEETLQEMHALTRNLGGVASEFGNLFRTSLTLGIKYFAF